jgi:radical SAM protein with 4Fe4S-binding SPASM domain
VGLPARTRDLDPQVVMTEEEICAHLDRACERAQARGLRFRVELDEPFRRSVQPVPPRFRWIMGHMINCLTGYVRERYPNFCSMATYHLKVAPTGEVYPCCRAPKELEMGNVKEQTVEQIWNGEKYRAFRRAMFSGEYSECCKNCDVLTANPHFDKSRLKIEARKA